MNFLKLSFFLILVATFSACGNDDDAGACVQSDWVGTYTGSLNCGAGPEDVTVTITASGSDAVIIKYEADSQESTYDPIEFDGCELELDETVLGLGLEVNASLDGTNFTLKEEISAGGLSTICEITATRN